jgi:hypothetical protein
MSVIGNLLVKCFEIVIPAAGALIAAYALDRTHEELVAQGGSYSDREP